MPLFYFHLVECGETLEDEESRDCDSLAQARDHAIGEARAIMCDEVRSGRLCLSCHVEIEDAAHAHLLSVPFRDAIEITGA